MKEFYDPLNGIKIALVNVSDYATIVYCGFIC